MTDRTKPALALSGGGFRATLYHLGALIRLNELGLLTKLERISSVSGGSITAGVLAKAWQDLNVRDGVITNFDAEVVKPIREFCTQSIDTKAVLLGAINPTKSIGEVLAGIYNDKLFRKTNLQDLKDLPQFVFCATNLQTGRLVRLSKTRLGDYTIGEIKSPNIDLATAVAASSAFPPILSPIVINTKQLVWTDLPGTLYFGKKDYTHRLSLTDGGVYDNLGLETVDSFETVIVSDGGAPFSSQSEANPMWPQQALRALDIATDQARALRKRLLHAESKAANKPYVYAGIDGKVSEYSAKSSLKTSEAITSPLARMRTRLNPFSEIEQGQLINWGWLIMDLSLRSYHVPDALAPHTWPCPNQPLG
jgi:NTE family protein